MAEKNYFNDAKEKVLQELDGSYSNNGQDTDNAPVPEQATEGTQNANATSRPQATEPTVKDVASAADPYDVITQQSNALSDATNRIQSYQAKIDSLEQQIEEQNKARREEIIENTVKEELTPPTPPDFSEAVYMSDEERDNMWSDFIGKSTEYAIKAARSEYQPYIDAAKEGQKNAKEQAIIEQMSRPESGLPGFADELPTIKRVIAENPLFKNSDDIETNLLNAYLLAKGGKSFNQKSEIPDSDLGLLTEQQLIKLYDSNPDFQKAVAKRMQDNLKEGANVPQFSASGNTSNSAAANVEQPVLTFKEAAERMKKYL